MAKEVQRDAFGAEDPARWAGNGRDDLAGLDAASILQRRIQMHPCIDEAKRALHA